MDIDQLRDIVTTSLDGSGLFSINGQQLQSDTITNLFDNFFENHTLVIENASIQDNDPEKVTVGGRLKQLFLAITAPDVEAVFSIQDSKAEAIIRVFNFATTWRLAQSFPRLSGSIAEYLIYNRPEFLLDSTACSSATSIEVDDIIKNGLGFQAEFVLGTQFEALSLFLNTDNAFELVGPIKLGEAFTSLSFTSPTETKSQLGNFELDVSISFTSLYENSADDLAETALQVSSYIGDTSNQGHLRIPIVTKIQDPDLTYIYFESDLEEASDLAMQELSNLLDNTPFTFPAELPVLDALRLQQMTLDLYTPNFTIAALSAVIEIDDRWDIVPGMMQLSEITFLFSVLLPSDASKQVQVTLSGDVTLAKTSFEPELTIFGSVTLPDMALLCELAEGSKFDISAFLEEILPVSPDIPQMVCTDFKVTGDVKNKAFSLFVGLENDWIIPLGDQALILKTVFLTISRDPLNSEVQLGTTLSLAGIDINLSALSATDSGWDFSGSTGTGQKIPIGVLVEDIAEKFGAVSVPAAIADLIIENLKISFNTKTKNFTFTCEAKFPVEDNREVDIVVTIAVKQQGAAYSKFFSGKITIDPLEFDLIFNQDQTATLFLASYQNLAGGVIPIGPLVDHISSDQDLIKLANSLEIELKDALFAYDKPQLPANGDPANPDPAPETEQAKFLFALDIGGGINLSNLPLVGQSFPKDQSLRVMFQPIITSQLFEQPQVSAIKALIPSGGTPLPDKQLGQGVILSATLRMGQTSFDLDFSLQPNQVGQTTPPVGTPVTPVGAPPAVPADDVRWVNLQKSFGPVHFNRVGLKIQDQVLWFFLDASLAAGGLTISLDGLGAGSSLKALVPQFQLRGLGIDYKNGPLEIGGAFLRFIIDNVEEYDGLAVIKTEKLSLAAIGSYTRIEDHPSMFLYAVLDYPLGGPAFFFITGLAAGFGYNRRLLMPPIEQVGTFPLVAEAVGGVGQSPVPATGNAAQRQALVAELTKLRQYVPPSVGQIFLAIGIKFTTFEMVESFALLAVQFGNRFELDVLGLSTLVVPTPEVGQTVSPLAEVQMALKATFIPAEGFLGIQAQLTPNSFILSRACRLTGGFAFFSWFGGEHEGDFVITLGGYHPDFKVPAHYPKVPRVGFNWQVTSQLTLKGGMYYALTASALMAGGELQAVWESSKVKAWFIIGADFLIAWKPYHYQARVYVSIGVSVYLLGRGVKPITVEVGADLQIWGPDFAGIAEVHLWIISFTIQFGSNTPPKQEPIDWPTFRSSFLPSDDAVCSVAVTGGLVRKASDDTNDLGIINPRQLALVTNSVIPVKTANRRAVGNGIDLGEATTNFGIGSMAVDSASLQTVQTITITHEGQPAEADFAFRPVTKNAPAGLWGHSLKPDLNGDKLISNTVSGFEIVPANPPTPGHTENIDRRNLQFDTTLLANAYEWGGVTDWFVRPGLPKDEIKWTITNQGSTFSRNQILEDLGFVGARDVDITPEAVDAFVKDPIIVAL